MRMTYYVIQGTLAALFAAGLTVGTTTAEAAATPVQFPAGSIHGRGHGFLHRVGGKHDFIFHARLGQHLRVNIVGRGPTRGVVSFPGGGQDGSPGGVVFDGRAPRTGDYRLRVTEDSMAEQWRGPVTVYVTRQ